MELVALVLGILAVVALMLAAVLIPVSRRAKRQRAELQAEVGDSGRRVENVRGLGLEPRGPSQVRCATSTSGSPRSAASPRRPGRQVPGSAEAGTASSEGTSIIIAR
jgi:hypothetical protein